LACTRVRHAPLFAVTAAIALADLVPHARWAAQRVRSGSDLFRIPADQSPGGLFGPNWRPALLPAVVLTLALLLQVNRVAAPVLGHGWARLDSAYWPMELLPELKRHESIGGAGTPIFNEYLFGGFLIYETPGYRVFVDDRCELYGDEWLRRYVQAEERDTATQVAQWERTYPAFDLALTRSGSGFDVYFAYSRGWTLLRQTETASLYRRASVETAYAGGK
jgi:hypothetical protein